MSGTLPRRNLPPQAEAWARSLEGKVAHLEQLLNVASDREKQTRRVVGSGFSVGLARQAVHAGEVDQALENAADAVDAARQELLPTDAPPAPTAPILAARGSSVNVSWDGLLGHLDPADVPGFKHVYAQVSRVNPETFSIPGDEFSSDDGPEPELPDVDENGEEGGDTTPESLPQFETWETVGQALAEAGSALVPRETGEILWFRLMAVNAAGLQSYSDYSSTLVLGLQPEDLSDEFLGMIGAIGDSAERANVASNGDQGNLIHNPTFQLGADGVTPLSWEVHDPTPEATREYQAAGWSTSSLPEGMGGSIERWNAPSPLPAGAELAGRENYMLASAPAPEGGTVERIQATRAVTGLTNGQVYNFSAAYGVLPGEGTRARVILDGGALMPARYGDWSASSSPDDEWLDTRAVFETSFRYFGQPIQITIEVEIDPAASDAMLAYRSAYFSRIEVAHRTGLFYADGDSIYSGVAVGPAPSEASIDQLHAPVVMNANAFPTKQGEEYIVTATTEQVNATPSSNGRIGIAWFRPNGSLVAITATPPVSAPVGPEEVEAQFTAPGGGATYGRFFLEGSNGVPFPYPGSPPLFRVQAPTLRRVDADMKKRLEDAREQLNEAMEALQEALDSAELGLEDSNERLAEAEQRIADAFTAVGEVGDAASAALAAAQAADARAVAAQSTADTARQEAEDKAAAAQAAAIAAAEAEAEAARLAAIAAASDDATDKAAAAQAAAEAAAAADASAKAQAAQEAAEAKAADAQGRADAAYAKAELIEGQVSALGQALEDAEGRIEDVEDVRLPALNAALSGLAGDLSDLEGVVGPLPGAITAAQAAATAAQSTADTARQEATDKAAAAQAAAEATAEAEAEAARLAAIAAASEDADDKAAAAQAAAIAAAASDASQKAAAAQAAAEAKAADAQEAADAANVRATALEGRTSQLESDLAAAEGEIETLTDVTLPALGSRIDGLDTTLGGLPGQLEDLDARLSGDVVAVSERAWSLAPSLLANGGFEDEPLNDAWVSGGQGLLWERDTEHAHTGEASARIYGALRRSQPFPVTPSETVRFSYWVDTSAMTSGSVLIGLVGGSGTSQTWIVNTSVNSATAADGWAQVVREWNVPASFTASQAWLRIASSGPGGEVWIDDVEVKSTSGLRRGIADAQSAADEALHLIGDLHVDGDMLVDGSVLARHIVAESVAAAVASFLELNASQITAGTIDTARLNALQIAAAVASVIELNADRITSGTINTARLNAEQVAAAIGSFLQLNASQIIAGTIDVERLDAADVAAAVGSFLELNAGQITSGTINTARLNAQEIAAAAGQFLALNAEQITSGTINTARLNAQEIAAAAAQFLQLDVSQLFASEATIAEGVIAKLFSDVVVARTAIAEAFIGENAILSGAITADKIAANSITASKLTMTPGNMVDDPLFNTPFGEVWEVAESQGAAPTVEDNPDMPGRTLRFSGPGEVTNTTMVPIISETYYRVSFRATAFISIVHEWYTADGVLIRTGSGSSHGVQGFNDVEYQRLSPENAAYARLVIRCENSNPAWIGRIHWQQSLGADLQIEGTINASRVNATSFHTARSGPRALLSQTTSEHGGLWILDRRNPLEDRVRVFLGGGDTNTPRLSFFRDHNVESLRVSENAIQWDVSDPEQYVSINANDARRLKESINMPCGMLYRPNGQTIANNSWITQGFPAASESHLAGGMEWVGNALVVPSAGLYTVMSSLVYAANSTGRRDVGIAVNGSLAPGAYGRLPTVGNIIQSVEVTRPLWLEAGDEITALAQQNSGGNLQATERRLLVHRIS